MTDRASGSDYRLSRVRSVIAGLALAGTISLESAAQGLATSPRTLQRRLRKHGMTFGALVDACRFEIAGALLRETDLKVQEIALRIGYSTPSTFTRAFARWSGCSPHAYRQTAIGRDRSKQEWREKGRNAFHALLAFGTIPDGPEEP
jgi:AraC-like DNA-binding protein